MDWKKRSQLRGKLSVRTAKDHAKALEARATPATLAKAQASKKTHYSRKRSNATHVMGMVLSSNHLVAHVKAVAW